MWFCNETDIGKGLKICSYKGLYNISFPLGFVVSTHTHLGTCKNPTTAPSKTLFLIS